VGVAFTFYAGDIMTSIEVAIETIARVADYLLLAIPMGRPPSCRARARICAQLIELIPRCNRENAFDCDSPIRHPRGGFRAGRGG
jgi:hypothetical protein